MALAAGKPCRQFTAYDLPGVSMSYVAIGNSRSWPTAAIIERVLITGVMLKTLGKECPTMYLWGITSVIQAISRKTTTKPTYCGSTGSSSSIPIQSNPIQSITVCIYTYSLPYCCSGYRPDKPVPHNKYVGHAIA